MNRAPLALLSLALAATLAACSSKGQTDLLDLLGVFAAMVIALVAALAALTLVVVVGNVVCLVRGKPSLLWGFAAIGLVLSVGLRALLFVLHASPSHDGSDGRALLTAAVVAANLVIGALGYRNVRGFMKAR